MTNIFPDYSFVLNLVHYHVCTCVCVQLLQSCPILYDTMNCSPPGSSVPGILQARILERLPCPSPGDLPHPVIKPMSPAPSAWQVDSLPRATWEVLLPRLDLHKFALIFPL